MIDYRILNPEDLALYEEINERASIYVNGKKLSIKKPVHRMYPKSVRHYLSLFPNKFADAIDITERAAILEGELQEFEKLINDPAVKEQTLLSFLKRADSQFLLGGILTKGYDFGHHALYVFPEFPLTVNYKPDFLLVGKNSDGHHFIFIECESVLMNITLGNGTYGTTIRNGIKQVEDWRYWLEKYFTHLKPVFEKDLKHGEALPNEFTDYDSTRMHFVVIAGRRQDFKEETYRRNRENQKRNAIQVLHYDNLIDGAKEVLQTGWY